MNTIATKTTMQMPMKEITAANKSLSEISSPTRQKGAVMIVCMILLTILTMIGIASVGDVNMQTQMARNSQFDQLAFQSALSELRAQYLRMKDSSGTICPDAAGCIMIDELSDAMAQGVGVGVLVAEGDKSLPGAIAAAQHAGGVDMPVSIAYSGVLYNVKCQGTNLIDLTKYKFVINSSVTITDTSFGSNQDLGVAFCIPGV